MTNRKCDEKSEENTCNNQSRVYTGLVVMVIIEMVVLLGLVTYWRLQRDDTLSAARQQHMCYPQSKLNVVLNDTACPKGLKSQYDESKNETSCCGDLTDVLNAVSNKTILNRYDSKINPEIRSFDLAKYDCEETHRHVSVPRLGLAQWRKSVPVESGNKLFWESDSSSFENSGLKYLEEDGQVIVEKEGYFYILLQLKIDVSNTVGVFNDKVKHHVHKVSDNSTSILLEDVTSPCQMTSDKVSEKTSVLGAVYSLKPGERLHVTTTHPDSIMTDPHNNHFSMYLL